ncbi:MAG TPA: hypothetical protein VNE16_03245 [Vicinamibacterales bacterium]|nr:hypothetical protein [Vicinamibacterales bacterium]
MSRRSGLSRESRAVNLAVFFGSLCYLGAALVLYGLVSRLAGASQTPLERVLTPLFDLLVLIACVAFVAFYYADLPSVDPPRLLRFLPPGLLILLAVGIIVARVGGGQTVPRPILDGFVLVAVGAAFFRLHRRT